MRKLFTLVALFVVLTLNAAEIGTWKAYPVYRNVTWIEEAGNLLYVLASDNLYSYNTNDGSITTYSKMNMLSDYYSKNLTYDKTIYDICVDGVYAYISTGFGIMKINLRDAEITETYTLGFKVNWCYIENGRIYAMSESEGQYSALLNSNLIDKKSWTKTGGYKKNTKTIDPEKLALVNTLEPGGPYYNYFNFIRIIDGRLYTVGGAFGGLVDSGRPGVSGYYMKATSPQRRECDISTTHVLMSIRATRSTSSCRDAQDSTSSTTANSSSFGTSTTARYNMQRM